MTEVERRSATSPASKAMPPSTTNTVTEENTTPNPSAAAKAMEAVPSISALA